MFTSIFALPAAMADVKSAVRETAVDVQTVDPQAVTGRLVSFSLRDGAMVQTSAEKQIVKIPIADIIRVSSTTRESWSEVVGVKHPPAGGPQDALAEGVGQRDRESWTITFTWGDVLCGRVIGARGETVVMETADLGEVPIPLDAIARIASARAATGVHRESLQWLDRASAESAGRSTVGPPKADSASSPNALESAFGGEDDRVLLTNGDVLRGFISAIDADGIAIDTGIGPTTAPFRLVIAARLAYAVPTATPRPYAIVTLRDGARLTATGLEWADEGVEAKLRTGTRVRIDADRVVAVDVIGGRWEWLSDSLAQNALERFGRTGGCQLVSYEQSPMLGPGWEYLAGRNVLSGPILVAGVPYDRGIGVHSRSNLIFELNGEYREFVTSFGMDDDSGPLADVTVVVLVDGQRRFEKAHVRRGSLFGPVRVDVSHAGRIELIVEYGDNGDMQDRFDWVEPGLIR
jgi:hypothetical protein